MDINAIIMEIDRLPYARQRQVADHILRSHLDILTRTGEVPAAATMTCRARWEQLRGILRRTEGEDINAKCRRRPVIVARWCAVAQMRADGYSLTEIAYATNQDRGTLVHSEMRINEAMDCPQAQPDFVRAWRRFQAKLYE